MANVVIAGGSEETRLLLRGLVRLHHHRVVAEGHGPETLAALAPELEAPVLILDVDIDDPVWAHQLSRTVADHPGARAVLVTSNRSAAADERAYQAGIHFLLKRPFAVHDLVDAITPSTPPEGPAAPSPPPPDGRAP